MYSVYERRIGDIVANEYWAAIEKIIETKMERIFLKYLPSMEGFVNSVKEKEEFVSTKEVCQCLKISRQTLSNWFSSKNTKPFLVGILEKRGKKNFYKINELIIRIKNNEGIFSKRKEFEHIEAIQKAFVCPANAETEAILAETISTQLSREELLKKSKLGFKLTEKEKEDIASDNDL